MTNNQLFENLTKPKKLVPGSTIGFVAPSAGNANFFPHRVDNAQKYLESLGYKIVFGKHSRENLDYVSSKAEDRASDLHDMFKNESVDAVVCTIGGNHSNQLLKHLDFELIKKNPKIFLGYSDISVLHYAFIKHSNLQTYYGPCVMTQLGEFPKPLNFTMKYFNKTLTQSENPVGNIEPSGEWTSEILDWRVKADLTRPRKLVPSSGYTWLKPGKVTARILGGCVPSINHLAGTSSWIEPNDCIFFIDIPEGHEFGKGLPISDLDAYLADLDNLGVFQTIKGLIVGRPYNYTEDQYQQLEKLLLKYTDGKTYPILLDVNIGHADPIITLPMGSNVTLNSEKNQFSIDESGVL